MAVGEVGPEMEVTNSSSINFLNEEDQREEKKRTGSGKRELGSVTDTTNPRGPSHRRPNEAASADKRVECGTLQA